MLFDTFDADRSGTINFEEFVGAIKGELNEGRLNLVQKAFAKIDKDGSGTIEVNEIISSFDPKNHPAVLDCRKTEQQVLEEFLSTFEMHHNNTKSETADFKIDFDEFKDYYANISASIDDEEYFALMMNSTWNLSGDADI